MSAGTFTPIWLHCPDCGLSAPGQLEEGATHVLGMCGNCGSTQLDAYELPPEGEWADVDWSLAPAWALVAAGGR